MFPEGIFGHQVSEQHYGLGRHVDGELVVGMIDGDVGALGEVYVQSNCLRRVVLDDE